MEEKTYIKNIQKELPADNTAGKYKRKVHLDILKIIAIFFVLFNHVNGYMHFLNVPKSSLSYWLTLSNAAFIKTAVPLFFMTSGAMLLRKNEPYDRLIRKRIIYYAVILFIVSAVNYYYRNFTFGTLDLKEFFTKLYSSNIITAYWYLYAYLAYLLALPLLRRMVQSMSNKDFAWLFSIYFVFRALPMLEFILFKGEITLNYNLTTFLTATYIIYPVAGYFIENRLDDILKRFKDGDSKWIIGIITIIIGFAAILISARFCHYYCNTINDWSVSSYEKYINTLVLIPSASIYYIFKMIFDSITIKEKTASIISLVSKCTFGVYLFENVWREKTEFIFTFFNSFSNTYLSYMVYVFCACALGIFVSLVFLSIKKRVTGLIDYD